MRSQLIARFTGQWGPPRSCPMLSRPAREWLGCLGGAGPRRQRDKQAQGFAKTQPLSQNSKLILVPSASLAVQVRSLYVCCCLRARHDSLVQIQRAAAGAALEGCVPAGPPSRHDACPPPVQPYSCGARRWRGHRRPRRA